MLNRAGESVFSQSAIKPEAASCEVEQLVPDAYKVRLPVTDPYDQTVTEEAEVLAG